MNPVHCDALVSVQKALLRHFVGALDSEREQRLDQALRVALPLA
ncbi:MAG: type II toxin-antitoxin system PemK/MazF family toxin [Acidobacteria bacterium]|jgi:mRNA-degrading endonuclease toxin of MazEF toxin-antitoxin module|nr:type II toxin-antitoxin system PemK/MazF family toxin [Acidobacteriota bacterium]